MSFNCVSVSTESRKPPQWSGEKNLKIYTYKLENAAVWAPDPTLQGTLSAHESGAAARR